jgi:predicted kinase
MKSFKSFLLSEGVHDPAKLKAIFLAGGPGSGKSHVTNKVRGDLGFKVVNSDDVFEHGMKKHGLDFKMPESEKEKRDVVRARAKELTAKRTQHYQHGRLGMIIDGTGKDYDEIERKSNHLKSLGYDTHMIFVNTSLDVAHARNKKRARSVPADIVTDSWNQVQNNIGKFQRHFGTDKFHVVDNSKDTNDQEALDDLHKKVRHIATKEVENPTGKKWIQSQLEKKNRSKPSEKETQDNRDVFHSHIDLRD